MGISVLYKPNIIIGNSNSSSVEPQVGEELYGLLTDTIQTYTLPKDIGTKNELRSAAFRFADIKKVYLKNAAFIPQYCFASAKIEGVVGSKVFEIASSAFYGCYRLKNVNIFSNCFRIRNWAFYACNNLQSLNIDSPYVYFQDYSNFAYCSNLSNVSIYNGQLASYTFNNCSNLGTANIGYTRYFGGSAFANCSRLWQVSASFAREVGHNMFSGCYNLYSLNGFDTITNLGQSAFYDCSELSSVFFPMTSYAGVVGVFNNCIRLSKIELGAIKAFGTTFSNCPSLRSLILLTNSYPELQTSLAFNGTPIADSSYLGYYGSIYVPSNLYNAIRSATNWVFFSDRFVPLSSGYDSKFIYAYEFYSQSSLKRIPNAKADAQYVGTSAFYRCSSLSSVSLSNCRYVGTNAFNGCTTLKSAILPKCQAILSEAFRYCSGLRSLDAPDVKHIDYGAFTQCSSLSKINLPNCKYIGSNAFYSCSELSEAYLPACEIIEQNAFSSCSKLSVLDLPNCVYFAGGCSGIESINIPKAKHIYLGPAKMSTIYFPNCLVFTGWYQQNSSVQEIYLPNVLRIDALQSAYNLRRIEIPNCVEIGNYAFRYCSSLSELFLPRISSIMTGGCFSGCRSLERIFFGNISYIAGSEVFYNCSSLNSLYLFSMASVFLSDSRAFNNTPIANSSYLGHYGSIYVPAHLVSEYQADSVWSYFSDRFVGLTDQEMQDIIDHWND